ncbi:lysozyme inhibitor LprI family protein [Colwellia sp. 20A7]|uniref:lysozyme inhibitor LprI family protein n=1 Tax=Colwellia sp. 20A7 TaxID=2689569 RepID=UPI0013573759|nr:lysozyme inhibitor LprI family protein [Colwellia sp. 20A7]
MIKNKQISSALLITHLLLSDPVYAHNALDECKKVEQTPKSQLHCLDRLKLALEHELQTSINTHVLNLEEKITPTWRPAALKLFRRSESDFLSFREHECRWQYFATPPEQSAKITYKQCYILITQNRIDQLSKIL